MDQDYYDPYGEEEDELNDESNEEETQQQAPTEPAEEIVKEYDLPDGLPEAPPLTVIGQHSIEALYQTLVEVHHNVADASRVEELRAFLKNTPDIAVALFQILHESGLAKAPGEDTEEDELNAALGIEGEEAMMEIPPAETPPLPPGATTWLGKPRQRPLNQ